jgi:hypothetical protein
MVHGMYNIKTATMFAILCVECEAIGSIYVARETRPNLLTRNFVVWNSQQEDIVLLIGIYLKYLTVSRKQLLSLAEAQECDRYAICII